MEKNKAQINKAFKKLPNSKSLRIKKITIPEEQNNPRRELEKIIAKVKNKASQRLIKKGK